MPSIYSLPGHHNNLCSSITKNWTQPSNSEIKDTQIQIYLGLAFTFSVVYLHPILCPCELSISGNESRHQDNKGTPDH